MQINKVLRNKYILITDICEGYIAIYHTVDGLLEDISLSITQ